MVTSLPAVSTALSQNGHPGYVHVTNPAGLAVGSVVSLTSSAPLSQVGLKIQRLEGRDVYLLDPTTQLPFNASGFLMSDTATLAQEAQDLFEGLVRDFFVDPNEDITPLATSELTAILSTLLPGGATLASNVAVTNFPAQQHTIVDNTVSFQISSTQNTGAITAHPGSVEMPILGAAGAAITITGTWAGTLVFEASADAGTTWFLVDAINPDSASEKSASSTTTNGVFQPLRLQGCTHVRVRTTAFSSGSADVYLSGTNTNSDTGSPAIGEDGVSVPTYINAVGGSDGTNLRTLKVAADGSVYLEQTGFTDGTHKTQVTNFTVDQLVHATSLPLPTGAATDITLTNGSQHTAVDNFPADQLVHATSLPLPTGAATETSVASISSKLGPLGQQTTANSAPVVVASNQSAIPVVGNKTNNFAAPGTTNVGVLPALANAAVPTLVEGNQTSLSTNLLGALRVDQNVMAALDSNNSTVTPLVGGATFLGTATDTLGFASISYSAQSDVVSASGGIMVEWSQDNSNWFYWTGDSLNSDRIGAGKGQDLTVRCHARYFRIRYINGASAQSYFRLQTILNKYITMGDTMGVSHSVSDGDDAILTKSVITGRRTAAEGSGFGDVAVDSHGALLTSSASIASTFGGNLAVSENAVSVFKAAYGINPRTCRQVTAGGGTITWAASQAVLQTSAAAGGSAKLATREAVRYVPGQGNIARFAPVFGAGVVNSRQAVGFLTDDNGFGFGFNGATFGILIRNESVDTWIPQSSWNGDDKFDGTGPSGVVLDPTKGSPMQIQMQWLGHGAVRWFIEEPNTGDFVLVHILKFSNSSASPSIQQPSLPVRMEVVNTTNATNITARIASMGGFAEGNRSIPGMDVRHSFTNVVTGTTTAGARVFSLRNKATNVLGGTNINSINVRIDHCAYRASSNGDLYIQIVLNPTLVGATYIDIDTTTSIMQSDITSTHTAGTGTILGTISVTSNSSGNVDMSVYDIRLAPGDVLMMRTVAETGTVDSRISMSWREEN